MKRPGPNKRHGDAFRAGYKLGAVDMALFELLPPPESVEMLWADQALLVEITEEASRRYEEWRANENDRA